MIDGIVILLVTATLLLAYFSLLIEAMHDFEKDFVEGDQGPVESR